jgi:hypothetical protein
LDIGTVDEHWNAKKAWNEELSDEIKSKILKLLYDIHYAPLENL